MHVPKDIPFAFVEAHTHRSRVHIHLVEVRDVHLGGLGFVPIWGVKFE